MSERTSFESMSEDLVGSGLHQLISSTDVIFKNRQELFSISPIGERKFSPSSSDTKSSYDPWAQPFGGFLGATSPVSKLPSASHSIETGHSPLKPSLVIPLPPPTTPPTSTPPSVNTFPAPSIDALAENLSKFTLGKSGHHTDGWIEEWLFGMGGMDGVEAQPVVGLLRRASKESPHGDTTHQSRLKAYQQSGSVSPLNTPVITIPPLSKTSMPNSPDAQKRTLSNPPQPLSFPSIQTTTSQSSTPTLLSPVSLTANGNTSLQQTFHQLSASSRDQAPPHHHHAPQQPQHQPAAQQQQPAPHHHHLPQPAQHQSAPSHHSRSQRRHQQQQQFPSGTTLSIHSSSSSSLSYQKRGQSNDQITDGRSSMHSSSGSVTESRNMSPMASPTAATPSTMSPRSHHGSLNSSMGESPSTERRHPSGNQFSQQQFSNSNPRNHRQSTGSGSSYESTGRDYMDIPSNGHASSTNSNSKYFSHQNKNGDSFKENRSVGSSHSHSHSHSQSSSLQEGSYYGSSEDELSAGSYSHGSQSEGYSPSQFKAGLKAGNKYRGWSNSKKEFDLSRFELDIAKVLSGDEKRTTLMVKNIPNKYTQEMLLDTISERHKGLYDFFYLPIDFKNKCNVGYAFINFIDPLSIPEFYLEFNQKRWQKFNSSKVCKITYARIQGKSAFIEHFRNSSLMNEEVKCRPLIFYNSGPQQGLPEPFPDPRSITPSTTVASYAPERRPTNDMESETPYAEENYNYVNI